MVKWVNRGLILAVAVTPLGCASSFRQPLQADEFLAKPSVAANSPSNPPIAVIESDPLENDAPKKALVLPTTVPSTDAANFVDSPPIKPTTTAPATNEVVLQGGTYMTLGAVVADVNGTPIYAHQVLQLLEKELAAKARELDAEHFRVFVHNEVDQQRQVLINDEITYAAAEQNLTDDDKKLVAALAEDYRKQKVTEAGGSDELARRRAAADGSNFDEMLRQQKRRLMVVLFFQRRLIPRIHITAGDMRDFYRANVDKIYSDTDQAQFRVIKIDPARLGGDNARVLAIEKINHIREKALRGDDFTGLASTENHDDYLRSRGGDPGGWIKRGSYMNDAIEKAVWNLEPGQVTPVVESNGAFYIAKLEQRKDKKVRPFDDQTVQDDIHERLFQAQYVALRDKFRQDLERGEDATTADDRQLDVMVEMAMQEYARWSRR